MTSVTVLGSGTLVPDHTRHSAAHLVECEGVGLLLDCGPGTLHGMDRFGVDWGALTHVAISHYHGDHVGDLPALMFAFRHARGGSRSAPLTLVGPPGFEAFLTRLGGALGDHLTDPGVPLDVVELAPGDVVQGGAAEVSIVAHPTPHTEESVAYRVDTADGAVGYTGDTGPSEAVATFLRGSRVLIAECALTDPPDMDLHLAPSGLATLAAVADPELLVVTHVYPPALPDAAVAELVRWGYDGWAVAATDGMRIVLGDAVTVAAPGTPV